MRKASFSLRSILIMLAGAFLCGLALNLFYQPTQLNMGGISGLALIIYELIHPPFGLGILTMLLNIPIFLLGLLYMNKNFLIKSLIGTVFFSLMLDLTKPLIGDLYKSLIPASSTNGQVDLFLAAVFGGVLFGFGLGLMMISGYTTGGTDILAVILRKKIRSLSIGTGLWLIDIVIVLIATVASFHHRPDALYVALYSAISLYTIAKAIDLVLEGFHFMSTCFIISERAERISERILQEMNRGVTGLHGQGMYSDHALTVLLCVSGKRQIPDIKKIVAEEDPSAFFFVMDTREVFGEGFSHEAAFSLLP